MTEYSKGMTNCMGSLSQLSEDELETLIKEATGEIAHRKNRQLKADISNAIAAIQKLSKHCCGCLEVEAFVEEADKDCTCDVELSEIEDALKRLERTYF